MKCLIKLIIQSLSVFLFVSFLCAQNTHPNILTLTECIRLAKDINPDIHTAKSYMSYSEARLKGQKSLLYPSIYSYGSFNRLGNEYRGNIKSIRYSTEFSTGLGLNQSILDVSSYYRIAAAKRENNSQKLESLRVIQTVISNVIKSYYSTAMSQQKVLIAEESVQLSQKILEITRERFRNGRSSEHDINIAINDSLNAVLLRNEVKNEHVINTALLVQHIGQPDLDIVYVDDSVDYTPYPITEEKAFTIALQNRPDYKAASEMIAAQYASLSAAKGELFPEISIEGSYRYFDQYSNSGYSNTSGRIGLNISVPIFAGLRRSANIDREKAYHAIYRYHQEDLKNQIQAEISIFYNNLLLSEEQVSTTEKLIKSSFHTYNTALDNFQTGDISAYELSQLKSLYIRAQMNYLYYLNYHKSAIAEIETAMGIIGIQ